jgi:type IV pilus assembly protein PilC
MKFRCIAWDRNGRRIEEVVDAESSMKAGDTLVRRGLFVTEVEAVSLIGKETNGVITKRRLGFKSGKSRLLAVFTRQLSVLVSTGTPLVDALEAVASQAKDQEFRAALEDVRARVEEGSTLADAMTAHTQWFDSVALSLVAAGESGGQLDAMLQRLSILTQQQAALKSQLLGAMVYPAMLSIVAVSVFILMTAFVVPRFSGLFETLDVPLPATTGALLAFSGLLRGAWWILLPATLGSLVGFMYWMKSAHGKASIDTLMVKAPKLSEMTRSLQTARMTRLMGLLLTSRVPLIEAIELTRMSMTNQHYQSLMDTVRKAVIDGDTLSSSLMRSDLIPKGVSQAVRNGERSGRMGEVLSSMADSLDQDNEIVLKSLSSLLEPVILVALGLMVGFVTISMFMPLFDVTAAAGGGRP